MRHLTGGAIALALFALGASQASAEDTLKIAIGQINNWENQAPTLGDAAGIFKKHNLKIEAFGTQGAGETIQAVVSGSADLGAGVGVAGVMRAFSKGAPVRVLLPAFTGTGDLYWYVKADSPIKSLKDTTASNTIAYSTSGSSSHNIVVAFAQELGAKGKATATGGPPGTLTQVMTGQIDVGWSVPPFALKDLQEKKITIIARGSDVAEVQAQTIRVNVANANALKEKRDAFVRYVKALGRAIDWAYSSPDALSNYATIAKVPVEQAKITRDDFFPKESLQLAEVKSLDVTLQQALDFKYITKPMTKQDVAGLFDMLATKKR
jgi:NitT/TauT family transport system substrate-binding protein